MIILPFKALCSQPVFQKNEKKRKKKYSQKNENWTFINVQK